MRDAAIADLARSGITEADAERAGMFDVDDAATLYPEFKHAPALVIPYYNPDRSLLMFERDGVTRPFVRIRYFDVIPQQAHGFKKQKLQRYTQPKGSGPQVYFCPLLDWATLLSNAEEPVIITEGEKKGLAGILAGFPVIALGGVYNFASSSGVLLPALAAAKWGKRDTFVCFDSDAADNPNIITAEARLVDELQRQRGAKCYLVRLPQEGQQKVGLDDYLQSPGPSAFVQSLQSAPSLGALDAKIVALNKSVAYIERENLVYDVECRYFVTKDGFTNGGRFGALKHITVGGKSRAPKEISVAAEWLKHPLAQRYAEVLFRPNEGTTVQGEHGRPALNMWAGWDAATGDVAPFLELTTYLFQNMRPEDRELPLKLIAYKVQNPQEKIPLALVLIGPQGCGKTLWGEIVREAFGAYGVDVTPRALAGEFQGWLETSLFGLINEAKGEDISVASEQLKALISDLRRPMNEKYRIVRQINTYTFYCITSNRRSVGAFDADDRRMIVVDCPQPRDAEFYHDRVRPWKEAGGARALLGYLLNLDLQGWKPPARAPMSAEKFMAYMESLTPVQRLAEEMRSASENTVKLWLDQAVAWARVGEVSANPIMAAQARATLETVPRIQVRPWYSPEELALMFPSVIQQLQGTRVSRTLTAPGIISRELRDAGVPYLQNADDPRGFKWHGVMRQFLVIAQFDEWRAPLRQADFDRMMAHWPTYGTLTARKAA